MSSEVKISYAYDKENDRQISVHKAEKGKDYECLECRGIIRKKGGEGTSRREHFFHKNSNSNCSISEESNLHNGSKLYLKECLEDNKDPIIFFNTNVLSDIKLRYILNKARIYLFRISATDLVNSLMTINETEVSIDGSNFTGDVVSRNIDGSIAMVWEIKVTHEIDPEKRQWLEQNKIPYIELKPSEYEFDEFKYEVISYGNIDLLKDDFFSLNGIKEIYEEEINLENNKYLNNYFKFINKKLDEQPVEIFDLEWFNELRDSIREFVNKYEVIKIKQSYFNNKNIKICSPEKPDLLKKEDLQLRESKYGEFLIFNNIKADSFTSLTGEFFRIIGNELGALAFLNDNKELYGVKMNYLDNKFNMKNILIPKNYDSNKEWKMLNLAFMKFNEKTKKYEFSLENISQVSLSKVDSKNISFNDINKKIINYVQYYNSQNKDSKIYNLKFQEQDDSLNFGENSFFSNSAILLKKTIEEFLNLGVKIEIIIQESSNGEKFVTGFNIYDVYSVSKYNNLINSFGSKLANQWLKDFCYQLSISSITE